MLMTMKVYWRETHLGGVLIMTRISRVPFTGTPKPYILMRGVFTGAALKKDIPIYTITSWERMLITLTSSTNTR